MLFTIFLVKKTFNYRKAADWEGKKVNLDGYIRPGRHFIKRNRGNQEGYLVLAPFTIEADFTEAIERDLEQIEATSIQRKFVLNLGWIPKSSKHLALDMVPYSVVGEETYEDRVVAL